MAEYNKPIPSIDPYVNKPFWDGAKEGKLMLPRCVTCNKVHWYPRTLCPLCHSSNIEWIEGSGEGYIHTFAVYTNSQSNYRMAPEAFPIF